MEKNNDKIFEKILLGDELNHFHLKKFLGANLAYLFSPTVPQTSQQNLQTLKCYFCLLMTFSLICYTLIALIDEAKFSFSRGKCHKMYLTLSRLSGVLVIA